MSVRWKSTVFAVLAVAAGCGGAGVHESAVGGGSNAATGTVEVSGQVIQGASGSILVFAYTDLPPSGETAGHEPASIDTVAANGEFALKVPPTAALTLVFLSDSANDGVVDHGDKVAILTGPDLTDLQSGDRVRIADARIEFAARRVTANNTVTRSRSPAAVTPTPVPAQ